FHVTGVQTCALPIYLFEAKTEDFIELGKFDRMLIDPPRDGALAVCEALAGLNALRPDLMPGRIVYVSCNPSTLARDAAVLVNERSEERRVGKESEEG